MPQLLASAEELVAQVERTWNAIARTAIIGISGLDCAGKSTLAAWLAARLGESGTATEVVAGDAYLQPRHVRRANPDQARGYYGESFDYSPLATALGPARARRPPSVVLVEGVFLFTDELLPLFDLTVWIEIGAGDALARARRRPYDLDRYGGPEAVEREYRRRFLRGQALHLELDRPLERAHAVLPAERVPAPVGG